MKKLFLLFLISFFSIFILSACSTEEKSNDTAWQDEIIFASECGHNGLRCCPDTETACLYGLTCCSDPKDPAMNYCTNECSHGTLNNFCRENNPRCDEGMTCYDNFCQKAGGEGQPCLSGNSCNNNLICDGEICSECGLLGNPCCGSDYDYQCKNEKNYSKDRSACLDNVCRECGFSPFTLCPETPSCNQGYLINNDKCLKCGSYNQPCCKDSDANLFCENDKLKCNNGFCL